MRVEVVSEYQRALIRGNDAKLQERAMAGKQREMLRSIFRNIQAAATLWIPVPRENGSEE